MPYLETIVCSANSRRLGRRCVAGKDWRDSRRRRWVRLVSPAADHGLSESDRLYADGAAYRALLAERRHRRLAGEYLRDTWGDVTIIHL